MKGLKAAFVLMVTAVYFYWVCKHSCGFAVFDAVLGLAALILYFWDKRIARYNAAPAGSKPRRKRISENTLHLVSLAGGWYGAWLARILFNHKTRKSDFVRVFWLTVLANLFVSYLLFMFLN